MSTTAAELSNPLPTAKQAMEMLALAEAEMASEALRQKKKARREEGVDRQAVEALWHFRVGGAQARGRNRPARGQERLDRGGGLPLSQRAVHGQRPRDQYDGAGLGEHPDRAAEGDVFLLGSAPAPDRIQDPRSGRRLLWRRAGRHRSHAEMGLNKSAIEQSCSAALIGTSPRRQNAGRRGTA